MRPFYRLLKTRTERFLNNFIPTNIQILNSDGMNVSRASTPLLQLVYDNGYQ